MKKNHILLTAAAICALAACSKVAEQEIPAENTPADEPQVTEWTYISAQGGEENVDGSSKASINGTTAAFTWNTGDKIAVWSDGSYHISNGLAGSFNNKASADFEFAGSINAGRANFAVFPASLVTETSSASATGLTLTLPATYALSDVNGDVSPTPMIATNAPGEGLAFKSVCALIRFTLTNVPKQTQSITFDFNGKKVQGDFTLSAVDLSDLSSFTGVQTSATNGDDDVITVTGISLTALTKDFIINIPVPAGIASTGEYTKVTITTKDEGGHKINSFRASIKSSGNWIPSRKASRKLAVTLPVFTVNGNVGFNNGIKAVFAPGNLQAVLSRVPKANSTVGTASSWQFASQQYIALGASNANIFGSSTQVGDVIDLFAWIGSSATYAYAPEELFGIIYPTQNGHTWSEWVGNAGSSSENDLIKSDWGLNVISDEVGPYPSGTWHTPSKDGGSGTNQWQRVLTARKTTASGNPLIPYLYAKSTLSTTPETYGLIVFPDTFTPPTGITISNANKTGGQYADNVFTLDQWDELEAVGCVFLPVTTVREKASDTKLGDGAYWLNYTASSNNGLALIFNDVNNCSTTFNSSSTVNGAKSFSRYLGLGVRLIRDVN